MGYVLRRGNEKLYIVLAIVILSGCAVKNDDTNLHGLGLVYKSDVIKIDENRFYTEVEAAPSAGRKNGAVNAALRIASEYCLRYEKGVKQLSIDSDDHLLVNSVAKLTFECR